MKDDGLQILIFMAGGLQIRRNRESYFSVFSHFHWKMSM